MSKMLRIVAAAALAVSGMSMVGCQNKDKNPDAGGMTAGGSTDTYGTDSNARYRTTGNIGVDTGGGASGNGLGPSQQAAPQPAPGTGNTGQAPNPASHGDAGTLYAPGTGSFQGSASGTEAGPGVRTNTGGPLPPNGPNTGSTGTGTSTGGTNSGSVIGGTSGNGTSTGAGTSTGNGGTGGGAGR